MTEANPTSEGFLEPGRILSLLDTYLPGQRGGGPTQSVANLVAGLGTELDFAIITRDRDLGERRAYSGVPTRTWCRLGHARVLYLPPSGLARNVLRLVRSINHDVLYLNSAFSPYFTLVPLVYRRLNRLRRKVGVIVAPRGEFSPGALRHRPSKKRAFLRIAKIVGLYEGILWQASTHQEARDIERTIGAHLASRARIIVASDVAAEYTVHSPPPPKAAGRARFVFLSRIHPIKNLRGAIELLTLAEGEVSFDIFGPIEDRAYWRECCELLSLLPANVSAWYGGEVKHREVYDLLGSYHLLLLPTMTENFGHVIYEALSTGCPVAISDQTPWHGLAEAGAGWDLPLDARSSWRNALQQIIESDQDRFNRMSDSSVKLAREVFNPQIGIAANRRLLSAALGRSEVTGD